MKKLLLINEFALKPRRLRNTFWLWGLLYPSLLAIGLVPLNGNIFPGEGEYIDGYVYEDGLAAICILLLIGLLFAINLSFKAMSNRPKIARYIICILQFYISIQLVAVFVIVFYLEYLGID